jgi:hypothetical protein
MVDDNCVSGGDENARKEKVVSNALQSRERYALWKSKSQRCVLPENDTPEGCDVRVRRR